MKRSIPLLLTVVMAAMTTSARSQSKPANGLALNHIAVYVHELQRATSFYEEILGLTKVEEPFHDGRHTWFSIGAAGKLHLIQGAEANMKRNKNDHLCFSVNSVEAFIANLEKHHIEYTNWPGTAKAPTVRVDGVKQIYFQDPDGHWIEVNDDIGG